MTSQALFTVPTQSNFSQLGNSDISVKGKGLTNVKMYVESKDFSKGKI